EEVGLRRVISREEVARVLEILREHKSKMSSNWNRRYRANLEKIRSGDPFEVAEVVRNLILRDREKKLSSGEKKMLDSARQILISELVLAQNIGEEEAQSLVDRLAAN
ncbi:MAG: CarD family transcriptional regulator, partial [Bacillota bacterium]|nr:CarD family transcriptional regulator [Bacillota bacterium]